MSDTEIRIILEKIGDLEKKLDPALVDIGKIAERLSTTKEKVDSYYDVQIPKCDEKFKGIEAIIGLVAKHEKTLSDNRTEKLNTTKNAQWRIAIIVSIVMGLVYQIGNILIAYLKAKVWH